MNKFICTDCEETIEFERFNGSMYFDAENYVIGFRYENSNDVICDKCYAEDDE